MPSDKKQHCKTLVIQLAPIQALGAHVIIKAFKAISIQVLNLEAYFFSIRLKLDKKTDQTVTQLCLNLLYSIITQNRSVYPK